MYSEGSSILPGNGESIVHFRVYVDHGHEPTTSLCLDVVVRGVMTNMAMDQPLPRIPRRPDDVISLARPDIDCIGHIPGRGL